jgi:hypothetical protein
MTYREVTMLETKELLRPWMSGMGIKTIAGFLGVDPKTVRRYVRVVQEHGLASGQDAASLTDEVVIAVMSAFRDVPGRPSGAHCSILCGFGIRTAVAAATKAARRRQTSRSRRLSPRLRTIASELRCSRRTPRGRTPTLT